MTELAAQYAERTRQVGGQRDWSCAALAVCGALSLVLYAAFNVLVPMSSEYTRMPRAQVNDQLALWSALSALPLPRIDTAAKMVTVLTLIAAACMLCYVLASEACRRTAPAVVPLAIVVGFAVSFGVVEILALPTLSSDLFAHILYARVFTVYHSNPYVAAPATFGSDPYFRFGDWNDTVTPYGPVWTYLTIGLQQLLGGDDIIRSLLGYRTLLFALHMVNLALIWKILGRLNPRYRLTGLVFYAWNPIVVLKGEAHPEEAMVFFLLLSVLLTSADRGWLAVVALTLSALTKFVTTPLLVLELGYIWQRTSLRSAALGAGVVVGLTAMMFAPFWHGPDMVARLLSDPTSPQGGSLFTVRRVLFLPGFVLAVVASAWYGRGSIGHLLQGYSVVLLWFAIFLMPPEFAWYTLPLIAVVSLVSSMEIRAMTLAVCAMSLLANMVEVIAGPYVTLPRVLLWGAWWSILLLTFIVVIGRSRMKTSVVQARRLLADRAIASQKADL